MVPVLIVVKDGLVDKAIIANDGEHLEELACQEFLSYDTQPAHHNFDDGYIEIADVRICLCWAEKP